MLLNNPDGIKEIMQPMVQHIKEKLNVNPTINVEHFTHYPESYGSVKVSFDIAPDPLLFEFYLTQYPGQCSILVSHGTKIAPNWWHRGLGTMLQAYKHEIAKQTGYTKMNASCTTKQIYQIKIFQKTGWRKKEQFINRRTANEVIIWEKEV